MRADVNILLLLVIWLDFHLSFRLVPSRPWTPSFKKQNILKTKSSIDPSLLTERNFEGIFEDILYTGDTEAVYRRNQKIFLHPQFLGFLQGKFQRLVDSDERSVINDVISMIEKQFVLSDGLGQDSEVIYEERLNNIVFVNPSERRAMLEEMNKKEELSVGFISFLQKELKSAKDLDVKVVLAEILREVGEMKGLGAEELGLGVGLSSTDHQLRQQLDREDQSLSLALNQARAVGDRNEQILAGLLFSQNDLVEDIFHNAEYLDSDFLQFLTRKISQSRDLEEREALTSLSQTIKRVTSKIQELESERLLERAEGGGEELSFDQVKEKMKTIQMGALASNKENEKSEGKKKSAEPSPSFSVKSTKLATFQSILSRLEETQRRGGEGERAEEGKTVKEAVRENYSLCDLEFLKTIEEEMKSAKEEGKTDLFYHYQEIQTAVNEVMVEEMEKAQDKLSSILAKREVKAMEAEAIKLTRRGEVNEALILLIEGNIQSARQEGKTGEGAVAVLTKILSRIREEKERKIPEQQKLLRQLLKIQDTKKRKELLYQAFKPSKKINVATGDFETNGPPEIPPPVFIDVVRSFILDFGNVDSFNVMALAQMIIDEAQEIATDLYGPGMTPQEQQRMMFQKNTVSVWDLAGLEEQAMFSGEEVPWSNDSYNDKEVEDVLGERVRKVGGGESSI